MRTRINLCIDLKHRLSITSFKAKISMGTSKIFKTDQDFYVKKLGNSYNHGLTRIELSSYFYSTE